MLLDEHYTKAIAAALRALGHDVVSVTERRDLTGADDGYLLELARRERRAVVTEDVRDFLHHARQLSAAGELHYGVILTSPTAFPRREATIGLFVRALGALLQEGAEDALVNQVRWLALPQGRR
jgi:predicted nuclease of predicted toxin-antitoxin system